MSGILNLIYRRCETACRTMSGECRGNVGKLLHHACFCSLFFVTQAVPLLGILVSLRGMAQGLDQAEKNAACVCKLCTRQLPEGSPGRMIGKQWCCRHCLSLESLLYRNLGSSEQQGWTTRGRSDFFKKSAETMSTGRYNWETVKTLVVEQQTEERVREQINQVRAKALPLNVWIAKGYEEAAVKKFPSEECPNLGTLYSVPVKETTLKEIRRLVEQEIQQKEMDAKGKNKGKRKNGEGNAEEDVTEWDVVPHVTTSGTAEGPAKASKVSAGTTQKAEKNLEKERAKQEKKIRS